MQTIYEICVTKVFHFLAPGRLTPGPKFTKRGDDLVDSEVYHPAKFHRSKPTHARDIPYKYAADTHTLKKQTVNDISTTCLSACGDKKWSRPFCHTIQHRAVLKIFPLNLQTIAITWMLSSGGEGKGRMQVKPFMFHTEVGFRNSNQRVHDVTLLYAVHYNNCNSHNHNGFHDPTFRV